LISVKLKNNETLGNKKKRAKIFLRVETVCPSCIRWLPLDKVMIIPATTLWNAPSPHIIPTFNDYYLSIKFLKLQIKLQTSLIKIQSLIWTDFGLSAVDILYQIQSLQTHALLLASLHELSNHNLFLYLALTNNSRQHLLSHSQKSLELLGALLMG